MLLPVQGLLITCKDLCFNLKARGPSLNASGQVRLRFREEWLCARWSQELWGSKRTPLGAAMEPRGDEKLLRERSTRWLLDTFRTWSLASRLRTKLSPGDMDSNINHWHRWQPYEEVQAGTLLLGSWTPNGVMDRIQKVTELKCEKITTSCSLTEMSPNNFYYKYRKHTPEMLAMPVITRKKKKHISQILSIFWEHVYHNYCLKL